MLQENIVMINDTIWVSFGGQLLIPEFLWQSPYNTVRYVVEGNGNAPNFFTVADNGQTFLKTSLLQRTETQFVVCYLLAKKILYICIAE